MKSQGGITGSFYCLFNFSHNFTFSKFSKRYDFDHIKLLFKNDHPERMLRFRSSCGYGRPTERVIQVTDSFLQICVKTLKETRKKIRGCAMHLQTEKMPQNLTDSLIWAVSLVSPSLKKKKSNI